MINKLILTFLIITPHCILIGQEEKSKPAEHEPIKITPLYVPDVVPNQEPRKATNATPEQTKQTNNAQPNPPKIGKPLILPSEWLLKISIESAPKLLKGIFFYLKSRSLCTDELQKTTIPSFHRFILVGPPGSGKTTLAHAIAHMLECSITFIPATSLLGKFRNETANNIHRAFAQLTSEGTKRVIIIDELHKIFEHHTNDRSDDSQSAAAFWLMLDDIEKRCPNIIIIGTANSVDKLPPEIKSRFSGKIITMRTLTKKQKIKAFKNHLTHDPSIILDKSVTDTFIEHIIQQIEHGSFRDIQLIIDTAKMFYYAQKTISNDSLIVLTKEHFQQTLDQLKSESSVLKESFSDKFLKTIRPWNAVFSIANNIGSLIQMSYRLYGFILTELV